VLSYQCLPQNRGGFSRSEFTLSSCDYQRISKPFQVNFGEVNMGKYIGYILCILVVLFALEYFQIVDIPYLDLPDIQTKGEGYKEKSEDNMKRRFGD
jgi:hypothetical protein